MSNAVLNIVGLLIIISVSVSEASLNIPDSKILYDSAANQYYYEYSLTYGDMASETKFNNDAVSDGVTVNTTTPRGVIISGDAKGDLAYTFNFNNGGTGFIREGFPLYIDSVEIRDNVNAGTLIEKTSTASCQSIFWTDTNTKPVVLSEAVYSKINADSSNIIYNASDNCRVFYYQVDMSTSGQGIACWNYLTLTSKAYFRIKVNLDFQESPAGTYAGGDGSAANPFKITTADQLIAIGNFPGDWDKNFELLNDIDLQGYTNTKAYIAFDINDDAIFDGLAFNGKFDGNNHIIKNMLILPTTHGVHYLGLFGKIGSDGIVCNLGVEQCQITAGIMNNCQSGGLCGMNCGTIDHCRTTGLLTGDNMIGGLCGNNDGGTITNSQSYSTVAGNLVVGGLCGRYQGPEMSDCHSNGMISGYENVGGLVGEIYSTAMTNCSSSGYVKGRIQTGGLIGLMESADLEKCWTDVNIMAGSSVASYIGGLCGIASSDTENTIQECCSLGVLTAGKDSIVIGGFLGSVSNYNLYDCYTLSNVIVGPDSNFNDYWDSIEIGGFAGRINGQLSRCYSAGIVLCGSGVSIIGGFTGTSNAASSYTGCFWDTTTSMNTSATGLAPSLPGLMGMDTADMKNKMNFTVPMIGWDFIGETTNGTEDIWTMIDGQTYPRFSWECLVPSVHDTNNDCVVDLLDFAAFADDWLSSGFSM